MKDKKNFYWRNKPEYCDNGILLIDMMRNLLIPDENGNSVKDNIICCICQYI